MKLSNILGICTIITLILAGFASSATTTEDALNDLFADKFEQEEQLMGTLATGLEESGVEYSSSALENITVFSDGFETSTGTGTTGFDNSVWEVAYGADLDEADIQTGIVHSGTYASHLEQGNNGDVYVGTKTGNLDLSSYSNCTLNFWITSSGLESGDRAYVDVYDGSWHYYVMTFDDTMPESIWTNHVLNLSQYNLNDLNFQVRWRTEYNQDKDEFYLDDVLITCIKPDDITPPSSVEGLETFEDESWIYLNWTNPSDSDFDHNIIFVNGINTITTSNDYYNLTGLASFTEYRIDIQTVDTSNNINTTNATVTKRTEAVEIEVNLTMKDSKNRTIPVEVIIRDAEGTATIANNSGTGTVILPQGIYDVEIMLENHSIESIIVDNATIVNASLPMFDMDDNITIAGFTKTYAINPLIDFESAIVTSTAKGTNLYKCMEWNFTAQSCYGSWAKIKDITPGQEYTFILTPDDPGLAESDGVFFEGFESNSLSTNSWTTGGTGAAWYIQTNAVFPYAYAGNYYGSVQPLGLSNLTTTVATTGYENITFTFYARTEGLDPGEYISASWYNGTGWTNLMTVEDIEAYTRYSYNLSSEADDNANFRIKFTCIANANNEECHIDNIEVNGTKIPSAITLEDSYGLNSTLEKVDEFNTTNLEEIEYMFLNFSITMPDEVNISSWYLNFTAGGNNSCSLGNKQSNICYNYDNGTWIQFMNNTETETYDGTQGNQGDRIIETITGSGNNLNISYRIDEHYNPNVFKWYDAGYNFSDVKWQNGTSQRITGSNVIKIEINDSLVPLDADQYKLDFRIDYAGNPSQPLSAFICSSNYNPGDRFDSDKCSLINKKYPNELQDDGTKFRGIFTKGLMSTLGDIKYVMLSTGEMNASNYYYIKTYKATSSNYTTKWEYTNDEGYNWTNAGDGYETELNLNWFYDGENPTAFIYKLVANLTNGSTAYNQGNITWEINPNQNYPPLPSIITPGEGATISTPYNIRFLTADPNGDSLNISLYLYQGGILNKTFVEGLNETNNHYHWEDAWPDGNYSLLLKVCETNTLDLFCANHTYAITLISAPPFINSINDTPDPVVQGKNITITANITDDVGIDKVWVEINGTNYTMSEIILDYGLGTQLYEGFESNSFATNEWSLSGTGDNWIIVPTAIYPYAQAGNYYASVEVNGGESILTNSFDMSNHINVSLTFYAMTEGLDGGEYIAADWFDGDTWNNLMSVQTIGSYTRYSYNLSSNANYNPDFKIRFRCSAGANNEECHLDSINLSAVNSVRTGIYNYPYNTSGLSLGFHNYTVYANDTLGDNSIPEKGTFRVVLEANNPNVTSLIPTAASSYTVNDIIEISANVTDDTSVHTVYATITYPNSTVVQLNLTNQTANKYNASFTIPTNGTYNIVFFANDTSNNINNTETTYFVTYLGTDFAPTSNSPSDQNVELASATTINWILQDDVAPAYYWVKRNGVTVIGPNAWVNGTTILAPVNTYFLGTWNYTIYFNDSYGNSGTPDEVLITVIDNVTASCDDLTSSEQGAPTLINITIDGDMSDWDAIIANPANTVTDLSLPSGDLDTPGTADRDMTLYAQTWNEDTLFMHWRRVNSGKNQISMLAYIDFDNDGYMNATDKVLKFVWFGSSAEYNSDLYQYVPSGAGGDLMNGSGYNMAGSLGTATILERNIFAGTTPGIYLETRINWSDLGLSGPTPLTIQPASANGAGTNLPSQIEDNAGLITTNYASLLFRPEQLSKSAKNGTSVYYAHEIVSCGMSEDTFDLTNISTQGWNITYYYPNGSIISDTNSNGYPDVLLDVNNYTSIIAKIDIPSSETFGTIDITNITVTSEYDNSYSKTVSDITTLGDITLVPSTKDTCGVAGSTTLFSYTIGNFQGMTDTIEISALSSQGWNVTLYYSNYTLLNDTDLDSHIDIGSLLSGQERDIIVKLEIPPGEPIGTLDTITIIINSSISPSTYSTATANTDVSNAVKIEPNYNRSVGLGAVSFFALTVTNCQNETDTIDITYDALQGWATSFYENDKTTLLTDSDADTIIDISNLTAYGGTYDIFAKVVVPDPVSSPNETITVYANSSINSSNYDTATINLTAGTLVTYSNAARTVEETVFESGDTIYTRANGLGSYNNVYFVWIDPDNNITKISTDIPVTAEDDADDLFTTNLTSVLGNWTIIVYDAQGDMEIGRTIFLLEDTQPPSIVLNYPPTGYKTTQTSIDFNWTATDNYDHELNCNLTINGVVNATNISSFNGTPENYTVSNFDDGIYYWKVSCWDDSGNSQVSSTRNFTIDTTNPNLTLNYPLNNANISSNSVEFNWTAYDNVDNNLVCNLTIDGVVNVSGIISPDGLPKTQTVNGFEEGYHNWSVTCWDDVNNANTSETWTFFIDFTSPSVEFVSQLPPDLTTTNAYNYGLNITYNITDNFNVKDSSVKLYYKANCSTEDCFICTNGSYSACGFQEKDYTSKSGIDYLFHLDEREVYPAIYNFNEEYMESATHQKFNFASDSQYLKIRMFNVSNTKEYSIIELFANATPTAETLRVYYCNSSYHYASPVESPFCTVIYNLEAAEPFNHTHSSNTAHHIIPFAINTTTGKTGNVYVTPTSYFLLRGRSSSLWNIYYITNVSRPDTVQYGNVSLDYIIRPDNTGSQSNLGRYCGTTCTANWQAVDEIVSDEGLTYVRSNTVNTFVNDLYSAQNIPASQGYIRNVTVYMVARKTSGCLNLCAASTLLRTNGVTYTGVVNNLTNTAYSTFSTSYSVNPQTGQPWTTTEVNNLEIGLSLKGRKDVNGQRTRATQLYAVVEYTDWKNLSGTVDMHLHQYCDDGSFYYYACANDTLDNRNCTEVRQDLFNKSGIPPKAPRVYLPITDYYKDTISINYTASISPNGYAITKYNITLVYNNGTQAQQIVGNNSPSLSYNWDTNNAVDGVYRIKVEACDTENLCSFAYSQNFTVDNTNPTLQFVNPTDANNSVLSQDYIIVNATSTDVNPDRIRIELWNTTGIVLIAIKDSPNYFNFTNLSEGIYYINSTVYDLAGNTNKTETRKITLDWTSPDITLNSPLTNYNTTNSTIEFNWTTTDNLDPELSCNLTINGIVNVSGISSISGSPTTQLVSGFTDGTYYWNITCVDNAGNTNTSETINFTIDTTKPSVVLNTPPNNYNTSDTTINFNWTATNGIDPVLECNLTIDGSVNVSSIASPAGTPTNYTVAGFTEGTHNWSVICRDDSGNVNTSETINFTVDTTPPVVTLNEPGIGYSNSTQTTLNVTFNCSVTDNIELESLSLYITNNNSQSFALNQTEAISGTADSAQWTLELIPGDYTWNCIAYDNIGNYDWGINRTVEINYTIPVTESPTIILTNPPSGSKDSNGQVNFRYVPSSIYNLTNCSLYINDTFKAIDYSIQNATENSFPITGLAEGTWEWYVNCSNEFGNTNISDKWTIIVDLPPGFTNATLIINETIETSNGSLIDAVIELVDSQSGETDTNTTSGTLKNITSGVYDIRITLTNSTETGLTINTITFSNITVTTNITEVIDIDNFTTTDWDFVNTYAINPKISGYDDINISAESVTGDVFVCEDWNFTTAECYSGWLKIANYDEGINYTLSYSGTEPIAYVESNYTINLLNFGYYLVRNNQTEINENGTVVDVLIEPVNFSIINISILAHNFFNISNDIRADIVPNVTGWRETTLIDPSALNFINATAYKTATNLSTSLWKCYVYNYSEEICYDDMFKLQDLTPSQIIKISFNSTDPIFIEQPDPINGTDSFVDEQTPDTNYGNSFDMRIDDRTGKTKRIAIEWNISYLPDGIRIDEATMGLYLYSFAGGALSTDIVRVNETWDEQTINWTSRPDYESATIYNTTSINAVGWYLWNLTTLVDEWYNGTYANQGLYVKASTENAGSANTMKRFYSSDYIDDITLRPYLNITWTDIQPPNVTLNEPTPNYVNSTSTTVNVTFNCSATDNVNLSNVSLYITNPSNSSFALNQTSPITGLYGEGVWTLKLPVGDYTWNCIAFDEEGLSDWGDSNRTVTITQPDTTPPTIILNFPPNNYNTSNNTINFNWTTTDDIDTNLTCNLTIDGIVNASNIDTASGVPETYTVPGFADGTHTWNVTCWDDAGNTNTSETRNFTVDTTPPSITLNLPPDGSTITTNTTNLNWTATDNIDSILECNLTLDGTINATGLLSPSGTPDNYTVTGLIDGIHYWNVTCVDNLGNANTSQTWNFTVNTTQPDITAPSITLNFPPNNYNTSNNTINFNWTTTDDIDTNLTCNLTIDGIVNVSGISATSGTPTTQQITGFTDGTHTWNVTCWDDAGNTNTSETRNFTIDTTPPTIVLNFPPNNYNTSNDTINFNWTTTDTIDTLLDCNLTINGTVNATGLLSPSGTPDNYTVSGFTNGTYYWNVTCVDDLGNVQTSETRNFTINTTSTPAQPLAVIILEPIAGTEFNQTNVVTIRVNVTDDDAIDTVRVNVTWDSTFQTLTLTPSGGDTWSVNFTNTNWVGQYNVQAIANNSISEINNSETTYFIVNDVTPPVITIITPTNGTLYSLNDTVQIQVDVTDPYYDNVDTVYANVTCGIVSEIINLTEVGNTQIFIGNYTNTTSFGTCNIVFFANDTSSNNNTAQSYFEIAQATIVISGWSCDLTESPQVVESGEKILFQGDVEYTDGTPAAQTNLTNVNLTIYYINTTSATIVKLDTMTYLQDGVWYYEWDAGANENGNYMGIMKIKTNEIPPKYPTCTALFTISGRGIFKITGISPDLINVNETVRLGTEITLNGEFVDNFNLANAQLYVTKINGTTQQYNISNGLVIQDGLVYLDGIFNSTGIYYLNWSVEYYNRTKQVQEIVVAKDWDQKLTNISVGGDLQQLILENKQKLIQVLDEMEQQQQFSEEEIFLITDAVNSMSRVANLLAEGEITEDQAVNQMNLINQRLEREVGSDITGYLTNVFGADSGQGIFRWWQALIVALFIILLIAAIMKKGRSKKIVYSEKPRTQGNTRRRYQQILDKLGFALRGIRNKRKQQQFSHQKNVPLTRYFEKKEGSERQKTLTDTVFKGVDIMKMKIKQARYAPKEETRIMMIARRIEEKVKHIQNNRKKIIYEKEQEMFKREIEVKKARPEEIFRPQPPKQKSRLHLLKERLHERLLRRKVERHIPKQKVKESGQVHTKIKASDLFKAMDDYKRKEDIYYGDKTGTPGDKIADDYDEGTRTAVFEENKALVATRNAINAIRDSAVAIGISNRIRNIPKPSIKLPRLNVKQKIKRMGANISEGASQFGRDLGDAVKETASTAKEKMQQFKKESEIKINPKTGNLSEADEWKEDKKKVKAKRIKKKAGKFSRRRFQILKDKVMRNFNSNEKEGQIDLLKDAVAKENVVERVMEVEGRKEQLENDRIKDLAWNLETKGKSSSPLIRKAFPSEKDAEAYQSLDSEINVKKGKKQKIDKLKEIYDENR